MPHRPPDRPIVLRPVFLAGSRGAFRHDTCRGLVRAFLGNEFEFWLLRALNPFTLPIAIVTAWTFS